MRQGLHWVLDPIDGTRGFVGLRQYAICLALLDQGQVNLRLICISSQTLCIHSQHIALIMQCGSLIARTCSMAVHCLTCNCQNETCCNEARHTALLQDYARLMTELICIPCHTQASNDTHTLLHTMQQQLLHHAARHAL